MEQESFSLWGSGTYSCSISQGKSSLLKQKSKLHRFGLKIPGFLSLISISMNLYVLTFISGKSWANLWEVQSDHVFYPPLFFVIFFLENGSFSHVVSSVWISEAERKKCLHDWNPLFLFLQAIEGFIFNQNANKTVSTEINTYRKRIKTVTILRMWWTLFWLYIQYFDIQVQTKVTLFSCRILWSKLPVISMCWDLLGKLYLYSRNPWYGFSFVKSTKIMYRGKSHYLRECEVS